MKRFNMKCLFPLDDLYTTCWFSPVRSLIGILKILFRSKVTYHVTNICVELRVKISLQPRNLIHQPATVKQNSVLCAFAKNFHMTKICHLLLVISNGFQQCICCSITLSHLFEKAAFCYPCAMKSQLAYGIIVAKTQQLLSSNIT